MNSVRIQENKDKKKLRIWTLFMSYEYTEIKKRRKDDCRISLTFKIDISV